MSRLDTTKRQVLYSTSMSRDCCSFLQTDQLIIRLRSCIHDKVHSHVPSRCVVQVPSPKLAYSGPSCPHGRVRRFAPLRFTNSLSCPCTIVPGEHLQNLLHWSLVAIHSQAPPTSAIGSGSPELKQTKFCFLENAYTGYHVFSTEHLTQRETPE